MLLALNYLMEASAKAGDVAAMLELESIAGQVRSAGEISVARPAPRTRLSRCVPMPTLFDLLRAAGGLQDVTPVRQLLNSRDDYHTLATIAGRLASAARILGGPAADDLRAARNLLDPALRPVRDGALAPQGSRRSQRRRSMRQPRKNVWAALTVCGLAGADQAFALVVDTSDEGLRIRTPQPPPDDAEVLLRVGVGEEVIEVRARVRHRRVVSARVHDVGLEFVRGDAAAIERLRAVLECAD